MQQANRKLLFIIACVAAFFSISPWGVQLDNTLYDSISTQKKNADRTQDIVVVGIDEPSFQQVGLQWPWPREIHAKLIQSLSTQGASLVAFDLLFPELSSATSDTALADTIREVTSAATPMPVIIGTDFKVIENNQYSIKTPIEPIGQLIEAGAKTGHVSIGIDNDGFVRRLQPSIKKTLSLATQAAAIHDDQIDPAKLPLEFLINYDGGARSIQQVSYYQALDAANSLPENFFQNKVVFVGVRSLTASLPDRQGADHYPTPLTRWQSGYTSGVMIHALAAASIIENTWITQAPRILSSIFGLIIGSLYVYWGIGKNLRTNAVTGGALLALVFTIVTLTLVKHHYYLPLVSVALPTLSVSLFSPYYNYLLERRQKRAIRKAFSSYVNKDIVQQIENDPDALKLGGKEIEGTVLFMDIAGFSGLSETESPETMITFINEFLSAMIDIGMKNGGTVERFLGDAIMLIWGAPTPEPNHANLACQTALEMIKKIDGIALASEAKHGFSVSARVGINSGTMTAGNIGGVERFCYTVLGDAVNLAARFEAANKTYGSRIIIGHSTKEIIDSRYFARLLDITTVKGRLQEEMLYELIGNTSELPDAILQAAKKYEEALLARQQGNHQLALKVLQESSELHSLNGTTLFHDNLSKQ